MVKVTETITQEFQLKAITLECCFCSARTAIYVSRERRMPPFLLWECFDCQKSDRKIPGGARADVHRLHSAASFPRTGIDGQMTYCELLRAIAEEENL